MSYENKTCKELIQLCKVRGIKNYSKKRKNELINLLTNLEVIPVVDVVKKSSTSFKSGKLYQDRIFNILTTIQINSKQGINPVV
jgi:hypothetical protein